MLPIELQIHPQDHKKFSDAVEKLQNHQPEDLSTQEFEKIRANAKKEWPDDFVMQLDYEQRQVASLRRLKDLE